ncbi:MAG: glycosyltransferase family 2 protein [Bacteroidales bacterium]|nr:glycosyltransferase family 2 protein [Bacteroidales bacterium]
MKKSVGIIIPAFNEENAIAEVLREIPSGYAGEIVVVDNNSTDNTGEKARQSGVTVLREVQKGYGAACLKGILYFMNKENPPDIIVFIDADHSDYPEQLPDLIKPIIESGCDLVIGSRRLGLAEKGSMTPQQIFGNRLATRLIWILYRHRFTDLGPFRAIRFDRLIEIGMKDMNYGWTVEMQVKAVKRKLKCCEVAVNYRRRIGFSKVSGTLKGTIMAGTKIIYTIFKYL